MAVSVTGRVWSPRNRRLAMVLACALVGSLVLSMGTPVEAGATPSRPATARLVTVNNEGRLQVRSLSTGRVLRNLGQFPQETDNGFALAPGGGAVYLVLIRRPALVVERVSTTTGRATKIGDGADPSVSPDGRYLAWATGRGFRDVDVRNLATGSTRTISTARLVGRQASLLNGQDTVVWLGNDELAALPGIASTAATTARRRAGPCSSATKGTCIIVIHPFGPAPGRHARLEVVPLRGNVLVDAAGAVPGSLIAAVFGPQGAEIARIDLAGKAPRITDVFGIPLVLPMAFGPDGDELLYLKGHGPVALWSATVGARRLGHSREILARSSLREMVW